MQTFQLFRLTFHLSVCWIHVCANVFRRREEKIRRTSKKHLVQMDNRKKDGSLIQREPKDSEQVIRGLPCPRTTRASLLRSCKGKPTLQVHSPLTFDLGRATFGHISIRIHAQEGNRGATG